MKRFIPALLVVPTAFGSLLFGCFPWVEETSEETITRPGAPELVVRLGRGSLSVREHLGTDIEVLVRRSARAPTREAMQAALAALIVEFDREQDPETVVVTGRIATARAFPQWEDLVLRLEIAVPAGTAVDARTSSGRIELRGLTGPVRATTAAGRISADGLRSPAGPEQDPILLRTGDGNIQGENLEGRFHAETAEGRIRLLGRLQEVVAVSADGRIEVEVVAGGAEHNSEWFLRTADGPVRLSLPRGTNALVSALGDITSEDDSDLRAWQREGPIALTTLGDGTGPHINLRASDGSIRLRVGGRH